MIITHVRILFFTVIALSIANFNCYTNSKNIYKNYNKIFYLLDTSLQKIDSLKWIVYAMNYYKRAIHYKYDSFPELSVLECSIKFNGKDNSMKDTIIYYFSFYKGDEKTIYDPKSFYFNGIGYSYKNKNAFPMLSNAYPNFAENIDTCKVFFELREKEFVALLKSYKLNLSSWLWQEAKRRKVF